MKCLYCGTNEVKYQRKYYCSRDCANKQSAINNEIKTGDGKYLSNGELKDKIKCIGCNEFKTPNKFSLINKNDYSIGRRNICKHCSKNQELKEISERTWKDKAIKVMLSGCKQRSKKANLDFSITKEDIVIPQFCPILGIELKRENRNTWYCSPSIDRIDNAKGYTKENIIVICRRANILKKDATITELVNLAEFYKNFLLEKQHTDLGISK